ncbi:unnamed protein product [Sympodiomycopsis kandeliae]
MTTTQGTSKATSPVLSTPSTIHSPPRDSSDAAHLKDQPVRLSWQDITYDIPILKGAQNNRLKKRDGDGDEEKVLQEIQNQSNDVPKGSRRILSNLNGSVKKGEMVAILGASGAGKTTLLNILSARLDSTGTLSGTVLFNGCKRDPATWKRTVGFVEQDDIMIGCLTVYEQLMYSAKMRLPSKLYSKEQKRQRVEEILDMLRLEKCRNTRIGTATSRGVSGGERKRTSIGVELVSDAELILLDEPTSGLDAYAAYSAVDNLKRTTRERGLSCLMTIHQPSWSLLGLYDKVQLLARGRVYYEGPPSEMIAWFDSLQLLVPLGANPVDYYITLAENADNSQKGEERVMYLINSWADHVDKRSNDQAENLQPKDGAQTPTSQSSKLSPYREWPTSWLSELTILLHRNWLQLVRDVPTMVAVVVQTLILVIIIGFAFFRLGRDQNDVLSRIGVLYFIPINTAFSVLLPVLTPLAIQRAVMKRERSAGLYRTSSFYLSKLFIEIPNNIVTRGPLFILLYWMLGLRPTAGAFFIFLAINSLQVISAVCLGLFIGGVSPSIELANIIAPLVNVVFLLFGGNVLPSPPPWFVWLRWISPITYTYMALSQNEFSGQTFECNGGSGSSSQCYSNGKQVLQMYNLENFNIGANAGFLVAISVVLTLCGYIGLRYTAHPRFRYE